MNKAHNSNELVYNTSSLRNSRSIVILQVSVDPLMAIIVDPLSDLIEINPNTLIVSQEIEEKLINRQYLSKRNNLLNRNRV